MSPAAAAAATCDVGGGGGGEVPVRRATCDHDAVGGECNVRRWRRRHATLQPPAAEARHDVAAAAGCDMRRAKMPAARYDVAAGGGGDVRHFPSRPLPPLSSRGGEQEFERSGVSACVCGGGEGVMYAGKEGASKRVKATFRERREKKRLSLSYLPQLLRQTSRGDAQLERCCHSRAT